MTCCARKLDGYPHTASSVFGQKGDLVGGDVDAHVGGGLQLHHVPSPPAVHNQNVWHTQAGSRL